MCFLNFIPFRFVLFCNCFVFEWQHLIEECGKEAGIEDRVGSRLNKWGCKKQTKTKKQNAVGLRAVGGVRRPDTGFWQSQALIWKRWAVQARREGCWRWDLEEALCLPCCLHSRTGRTLQEHRACWGAKSICDISGYERRGTRASRLADDHPTCPFQLVLFLRHTEHCRLWTGQVRILGKWQLYVQSFFCGKGALCSLLVWKTKTNGKKEKPRHSICLWPSLFTFV